MRDDEGTPPVNPLAMLQLAWRGKRERDRGRSFWRIVRDAGESLARDAGMTADASAFGRAFESQMRAADAVQSRAEADARPRTVGMRVTARARNGLGRDRGGSLVLYDAMFQGWDDRYLRAARVALPAAIRGRRWPLHAVKALDGDLVPKRALQQFEMAVADASDLRVSEEILGALRADLGQHARRDLRKVVPPAFGLALGFVVAGVLAPQLDLEDVPGDLEEIVVVLAGAAAAAAVDGRVDALRIRRFRRNLHAAVQAAAIELCSVVSPLRDPATLAAIDQLRSAIGSRSPPPTNAATLRAIGEQITRGMGDLLPAAHELEGVIGAPLVDLIERLRLLGAVLAGHTPGSRLKTEIAYLDAKGFDHESAWLHASIVLVLALDRWLSMSGASVSDASAA